MKEEDDFVRALYDKSSCLIVTSCEITLQMKNTKAYLLNITGMQSSLFHSLKGELVRKSVTHSISYGDRLILRRLITLSWKICPRSI